MIPVYVINLARSTDRRAFMENALGQAGVSGEFVAAVDGRGCRARSPRAISTAETALILSHRKVWRRFLRGAAEYAVVLEDDAHLGEGFAELLEADWRARSFDAVKLETMFHLVWLARRGRALGARALHRLGSEHFGTAGYLVSREGARKMLALTRGLDRPVDHALFGREAMRARKLRVLQLVPAAVVQDNIHPDANARRELPTTLHENDRLRLAEDARRGKPRGRARLVREALRFADQVRRAMRFFPAMGRARVPWR